MARPSWQVGFVLAVAGLGACGSSSALLERLDERAGMTLVSAREPLVFARTEPRYSRSARDYLYLGPVETNRQGVREYYLWVGVATTLDRGFIAPPADPPRILYLVVDGEPMELVLRPWSELVRTTIAEPLYEAAAPLQAELAARVTLQQLELLGARSLDSIAVGVAGQAAPRTYVPWGRGVGFGLFLAGVGRGGR